MTRGKSETVNISTIWLAISVFFTSSTASATKFNRVSSPTKCTTVNIKTAAIAAVLTKIRIRQKSNFPTLLVSDTLAMEPEMEKKIKGTSRVNKRFKKICPTGFKKATFSRNTNPKIAPIVTKSRRSSGS